MLRNARSACLEASGPILRGRPQDKAGFLSRPPARFPAIQGQRPDFKGVGAALWTTWNHPRKPEKTGVGGVGDYFLRNLSHFSKTNVVGVFRDRRTKHRGGGRQGALKNLQARSPVF